MSSRPKMLQKSTVEVIAAAEACEYFRSRLR